MEMNPELGRATRGFNSFAYRYFLVIYSRFPFPSLKAATSCFGYGCCCHFFLQGSGNSAQARIGSCDTAEVAPWRHDAHGVSEPIEFGFAADRFGAFPSHILELCHTRPSMVARGGQRVLVFPVSGLCLRLSIAALSCRVVWLRRETKSDGKKKDEGWWDDRPRYRYFGRQARWGVCRRCQRKKKVSWLELVKVRWAIGQGSAKRVGDNSCLVGC